MVRVPPAARDGPPPEPGGSRRRLARREDAILAAALALSSQGGCLAMRMADLAKAAGISIGSLYRHFESKEDVVVGLACEALRRRLAELERACASPDLGAAERLVAGVIGDVRFSLGHPALFGAEELGATRAIRVRASPRRVEEFGRLDGLVGECIERATRAAVAAGAFLPSRDAQARIRTIREAVRTLMAGTARTLNPPASADEARATAPRPPEHFLDVCAATFAGLDWRVPYPRDAVDRIVTQVFDPVA